MSVTYHLLHNLLLSSQSHLSPFPVLQSYWKVYNSLKHAHHYSLHTFKHSFPLQKSLYDRYLCLCGRPICPLTYILFETFHEPPSPKSWFLLLWASRNALKIDPVRFYLTEVRTERAWDERNSLVHWAWKPSMMVTHYYKKKKKIKALRKGWNSMRFLF